MLEQLTNREKTILIHLAEGLTKEQIAEKLGLASNTIKNHLQSLRDKTGTTRTYQLIGYYMHKISTNVPSNKSSKAL